MSTYCIYLRKSRADQEAEAREKGDTLAKHRKILLDLAQSRGFLITQIYEEVVSGETISDRPVMQRLLREVEQRLWTGVLVVEVERLSRGDTVDQGTVARAFKYSNTKIITPFKTFDPSNEFDEQFFEFNLYMSRQEHNAIKRRLLQWRVIAAKQGKRPSGYAPFGYDNKKLLNAKGWTLSVNEREANTVRLIFELYTTPEMLPNGQLRYMGTIGIANKLNALKIPTPSGKQFWSHDTIRNILRNPVYVGKIRWGYKRTQLDQHDGVVVKSRRTSKKDDIILADGLHPAIVSQEVFDKANALMEKKNHPPVIKDRCLKNPLAGVLFCAKCGRSMIQRPGRGRPTIHCPEKNCSNVSSYLDIVEERLLQSLEGWLSEYRLNWESESDDSELLSATKKSLKLINDNIAALNVQLNRTYELLEQNVYDTDTFLMRQKEVSERLAAAKKEAEDLSKFLVDLNQRSENKKNVIPKVKQIIDTYRELPSAQAKNILLKEVLEKVTYLRNERSFRSGPCDNFELILFPKLPDSRK